MEDMTEGTSACFFSGRCFLEGVVRSVVCVAEDRPSCEPGVELLIRSLLIASPWAEICVFAPNATHEFSAWLSQVPHLAHEKARLSGSCGWNVKPHALLRLLELGFEEVIWIDSDVILTDDLRKVLGPPDGNDFVVAEEALWGAHDDSSAKRARAWGFQVGRQLPFCLNSAILRVTAEHKSLLLSWKQLLESPEYRAAQAGPWSERPIHMIGDQDVLTALLSSEPFADVELRILQRGKHIIQYFGLRGYTAAERLRNLLFGLPVFIHSQGVKRWSNDWHQAYEQRRPSAGLRVYLEAVYSDLSPYALCARTLCPSGADWTNLRFRLSKLLFGIGLGVVPLVGLPIAAGVDIAELVTRTTRGRRHHQPE